MARRRILVVEGDEQLAKAYEAALRGAGFDVEVAGDGLSALEDMDAEHPDLVVTELQLPHLGGEAILHEAAATAETRDIPFIVLGAPAVGPHVHASTVLRTPCTAPELVAQVRRQLSVRATPASPPRDL